MLKHAIPLIASILVSLGAHAAPFAFLYQVHSPAVFGTCAANLYVVDLATESIVQVAPDDFAPGSIAAQPGYPLVLKVTPCVPGIVLNNGVNAYDPATNSSTRVFGARITLSVALNASATRFYASSNGCLTVVDASTFARIAEMLPVTPVDCPTLATTSKDFALAANPVLARLYSINTTGVVRVFDTAANTLLTTIPIPPPSAPGSVLVDALAVNDAGTRVVVTNAATNTVLVIDATTNAVIATVPVGLQPTGVITAGNRAYISNRGSGTVSVLDLISNTIIATIPVGTTPVGIDVNPGETRVYVPNNGNNGQLTVIDVATNSVVNNVAIPSSLTASGLYDLHGRFIGGVAPAPAAGPDTRQVPTLGEWGTILLLALVALTGAWSLRNRLR